LIPINTARGGRFRINARGVPPLFFRMHAL
jgi:hypothetical protein